MTDQSTSLRQQCTVAAKANRGDRQAEVDKVITIADKLVAADDDVPAQEARAQEAKDQRARDARHAAVTAKIQQANAALFVAALGVAALGVVVLLTASGALHYFAAALFVVFGVMLLAATAKDEPTAAGTRQPDPVTRKALAGFAPAAALVLAALCWGWLWGWFGWLLLSVTTIPSVFMLLTELDAGNHQHSQTQSQ